MGYEDTTTDWVEADGNPGLHADWPYYPAPPGGLNALLDLCQYPRGTTFLAIDDIDQVLLLLAEQYRANGDDYHDDNFFAAGWHEDLKHLQEEGLVAGLEWGTLDEWTYSKWQNLVEGLPPGTEIFTVQPDGTRIPVPAPPLPDPGEDDDFDFDFDSYKTWPLLREGANRLTVTAAGWATLEEHLREALTLHPDLNRVSTLLKLVSRTGDPCKKSSD